MYFARFAPAALLALTLALTPALVDADITKAAFVQDLGGSSRNIVALVPDFHDIRTVVLATTADTGHLMWRKHRSDGSWMSWGDTGVTGLISVPTCKLMPRSNGLTTIECYASTAANTGLRKITFGGATSGWSDWTTVREGLANFKAPVGIISSTQVVVTKAAGELMCGSTNPSGSWAVLDTPLRAATGPSCAGSHCAARFQDGYVHYFNPSTKSFYRLDPVVDSQPSVTVWKDGTVEVLYHKGPSRQFTQALRSSAGVWTKKAAVVTNTAKTPVNVPQGILRTDGSIDYFVVNAAKKLEYWKFSDQ